MGLGDVKLIFLLGLVVGDKLPWAFFVAVLSGAVVGLLLIAIGKAKLRQPIPFGPFLVLGALAAIFFGEKFTVIFNHYAF